MREYDSCLTDVPEEKDAGVFKTILLIVTVVAFLAGVAAALAVVVRKILDAMTKVNKETEYPPIEDGDLTSTDELDADLPF